ncbi:hypothetical protein [Ferruginibacter sp.]
MIILPTNTANDSQQDNDVVKAWEWFKSFIPEKEWKKRKADIEKTITVESRTTEPFSEFLTSGTLLSIKDDVIGWYLYLIEMLLNDPLKYEPFQGARVIPIFKRFGIDLELLKNIEGIERRIKGMIKKRRSEADAILFEILTALLWARNGYKVSFVPERHQGKTPDLIAEKGNEKLSIECKRQTKTGEYSYQETAKRQKMVSFINELLMKNNILLNIVFHVELETLPDDYLLQLLKTKLKLAIPGKIVSNKEVDIDLSFVDIFAIKEYLNKYGFIKNPSPTLHKLIGGTPVDNKSFTCGVYANFTKLDDSNVSNAYIRDISNAYGVYWDCDAEEVIWKKARDIKKQIYKAIQQFTSDTTGVIHVGMETYENYKVENKRFEKIKETIKDIDPNKSNLRWIFCHFFQSYTPSDLDWIFDETVSTISPYVNKESPLNPKLMIVPEDKDTMNDILHWDRPLP